MIKVNFPILLLIYLNRRGFCFITFPPLIISIYIGLKFSHNLKFTPIYYGYIFNVHRNIYFLFTPTSAIKCFIVFEERFVFFRFDAFRNLQLKFNYLQIRIILDLFIINMCYISISGFY